MVSNKLSIFDFVLVVLAVIGLLAMLGVAGMWVMHTSMMHGVIGCGFGGGGMMGR